MSVPLTLALGTMERSVLTLESLLVTRNALALSARRRYMRVAVVHLLFGLAMGVVVYLATPYDLKLAIFLGASCAAFSAFPVAMHWRRHQARLVSELDVIEHEVKSGMVVYDTSFEMLARHAEYLSDRA